MLAGLEDKEIEALSCQRGLRAKERGFSLVELLISGFILSIIVGSLFISLNRGESSSTLGSAKADLQAKVRLIMNWIVKDVRQTNLIQINTNDPSGNHVKFKKVTGIDNSTGAYTLSSDFTEYIYNGTSSQLTRRELDGSSSVLRSVVFGNITQSPFYVDVGTALAADNILTSKKLVVVIAAQSQVRNFTPLNLSLTEEVKIRNE